MASYDSDSSDGDDASYNTTNVLLGYASKEPTDDTFSQLGGFPVSFSLTHMYAHTSTNAHHGPRLFPIHPPLQETTMSKLKEVF